MKNLTALALASILGLALIPAAASAQEFGGVPNSAYRDAPITAPANLRQNGFQASAEHIRRQAPAGDYTADQLEGLMGIATAH